MIKYNLNNINDWNFGEDNIIKVYRNNAVCYYKVTSGTPPAPTAQTPCFAVVDDISQYSDTEFEDVFNLADEKWYKLNNLNQYEQYGIYGSGRTITTYEGKLTIDEETSSRLPQGYTEVEYIEDSGSQYIDTGVYLDTSNFEVGCEVINNHCFWGYCHQNIVNGTWLGIESTTSHQTAFYGKFNTSDINNISSYLSSVENTIVYTQSGVTVNGSVLSKSLTMGSDNIANKSLVFFGRYDFKINNIEWQTNSKFKSFYVKNNGTLVRDFVPCKRDSDDKYGMYDLVTDTFYVSPNGNDFIGGEPVIQPTKTYEYIYSGGSWINLGEVSGSTRLPQGYTEVEYISSENTPTAVTGPYIDTNFTPNQNTRVVLDYQATVINQTNRRIFGSGRFNNTSSGNYIWSMENRIGQSNCYYYYKFDNGSSWKTSTLHPDLNRHIVDFNKEGKIWLDDTAVITLPSTSFTCSYHLGLFNEIGTATDTSGVYECLLGRVYSCQVYNNGTLVRDLVPCVNSNNTVGMYDLVNDAFYTTARNQYQFSAGTEVTGQTIYPIYYDVIQDPPDNVTFTSMTEAESYQCPWWGMTGIIDNTDYMFCEGNEWLTKYVYQEVSGEYICDNGDKYKKMQEYDRIPDGTTTATTTYVKGDLIESASTDCSTDYSTYYLLDSC